MNYIKYDIRATTTGAKELREMLNSCSCISVIKQEEPTMKVSYNGFTGEMVKLEKSIIYHAASTYPNCTGVASNENPVTAYDLSIYDIEKKVTHSFTGVNLKDIKFLGSSVSFE